MWKYLLGILLVQAVTIILVIVSPDDLQGLNFFRLLIPIIFVGAISAFWFSSMAQHLSKDKLAEERLRFAEERENLRVNAERAKTRVVKQAQKDIAREAKTTHAKANFKVGATLAGAIGLGSFLLLTQFLTIGVVMLATAGGALGGYLYRGNRYKKSLDQSSRLPSSKSGMPTKIIADSRTK